jgi:hypothetical protein
MGAIGRITSGASEERLMIAKTLGMASAALIATLASSGIAAAPAASANDEKIINSATSAAPTAVGRNATVVAMTADGKMRVVRQGTNGFTCMADNPDTPGPDPMCMDKASMNWLDAYLAHKPPPQKVGFMYMLAGGTDASNTDPYATKPTAQNHWVKTGPHVMVVGAGPEFLAQYPASADPDTTQPYVMWSGTPYAHLMIPVH